MSATSEIDGHVIKITIDRPEARNAVNGAVAAGIEAALDRYESDDQLWCAVLAAEGPVFCAGADLKEIAAGNSAALMTKKGGFGGLVSRKRTKPLIAAVGGKAFAGGCELALACDMVVASESAAFGLPEVKRCLVAGAGGLFRLPRAVGMATAMEMLLTGDPISATRAHELGLVNRLTEDGKAVEAAMELAQTIAANAPLAVQATHNIAARAFADDDATLWADSGRAFLDILGCEDAKEGPLAFIEKRAPVWKAK